MTEDISEENCNGFVDCSRQRNYAELVQLIEKRGRGYDIMPGIQGPRQIAVGAGAQRRRRWETTTNGRGTPNGATLRKVLRSRGGRRVTNGSQTP